MAQPGVEKNRVAISRKEWRRPVLRKLPIAATANKTRGQRGGGARQGRQSGPGFLKLCNFKCVGVLPVL